MCLILVTAYQVEPRRVTMESGPCMEVKFRFKPFNIIWRVITSAHGIIALWPYNILRNGSILEMVARTYEVYSQVIRLYGK